MIWTALSARLLCVFTLFAPQSSGADLGLVTVELRGETKTWTETGPVYETTDDARFLTERYGQRFSYAFSGLPPGRARLKLGFCEFKYTEPGKRVFDILANGAPWQPTHRR